MLQCTLQRNGATKPIYDDEAATAIRNDDPRWGSAMHEAPRRRMKLCTLMHETTASGQLTKLLSRDQAPRRAVNWAHRIGTLSKPFDRRYVFFSSLASLLSCSSSFFSLLLLCMAITTREWRRRRFSPRGFPYEFDWPSLRGSWFCFFFRFYSIRDQEFSAKRGG